MISRIAPLGLRTCSILASGYIGIALYRSDGNALLGSSVGPVAVCTVGGATGAATGEDLQAANPTRSKTARTARMNRSGAFCVLIQSGSRFLKSVNRPKKQRPRRGQPAACCGKLLDRREQPRSQGDKGGGWCRGRPD